MLLKKAYSHKCASVYLEMVPQDLKTLNSPDPIYQTHISDKLVQKIYLEYIKQNKQIKDFLDTLQTIYIFYDTCISCNLSRL